MSDEGNNSASELITVGINKGFFFNQHLGLPTVIKEYAQVERILVEARYLACITIQIGQLHQIEYRYGSVAYNNLLTVITGILKALKAHDFRKNDIFVVDLFDVDTFVIFLAPPRDDATRLLDHLEKISERIRIRLEEEIFRLFYPYLKEYTRLTIGHALVIRNPMINSMRLIMQVIAESKKMGEFMSAKQDHRSKYTLQKIIIEQKIQTVFQPIVELESLEILGYEALSRGPEDTEFYNPLILFIVAAESGLSFELDRLCRSKSLESVRHMKTDKKIFVNTLTMTIHDPEFRGAYLKELLEDLKLKPENVVFEVSETLAIDNYELFRSAFQDYSDIGIVHANDDLGTGYSDLERVMELNPGYMKIDISFVRDIHKNRIKQEIVRAMVNLAQGINSTIIAEGVETKEEYEKLKELNVRYGQGFLFAKPTKTIGPINKTF